MEREPFRSHGARAFQASGRGSADQPPPRLRRSASPSFDPGRRASTIHSMSTFFQDLKFGARLLAKTPGFTIIAALSLALGIGANTTIFTLVNAVLLNPLPVQDPSQLVSVFTTDERNQNDGFGFLQTSPMNFKDLRDKNEEFSGLTAHAGIPL